MENIWKTSMDEMSTYPFGEITYIHFALYQVTFLSSSLGVFGSSWLYLLVRGK
jgi:hypothetical protein